MNMPETATTVLLREPVPSADGAVVLDLEHDRLLKLNPAGVEIWKLLDAGRTEAEIVKRIAQKYGVDSHRVAGDVQALLRRISELGIEPGTAVLTNASPSHAQSTDQPTFRWYAQDADHPSPKPKPTTVLCALLGLIAFDFILSFRSFKSLCSWVAKFPVKHGQSTDASTTGFVCGAVERACVWYPKKALCLQRSAVTACLLRFHGIPARMTIGVRPMPFLAHAWVEVDGAVVNDFPNVKNFYPSLASY
jgi:Transglutaminase-like superfamily/Coenzyme PQQ synthesis protein D (PqqD)